jgi:NAD(P)-dependent dehydrogenase (short-subunit alcohol dehydrogenase family)
MPPRTLCSQTQSKRASNLFNNAGYGMAGPLEGLTDEQVVRMIDTNLLGAIRVTKAFVPHCGQACLGGETDGPDGR